MGNRAYRYLILAGWLVAAACASTTPPSRLADYLGSQATSTPDGQLPTQRPVRTALIVITDTDSPQAAPALPEEARLRIANELKDHINRGYPVVIETIIPSSELTDGAHLSQLGKKYGVDYLLVTVLSSEEREYPVSLFLGYTTHRQPGFRRDNWSLAEAGLVDIQSGQLLLRGEGRAMATLDSPTAPGIDQWYPVIYFRPQDPERRIRPPTYEGAPITLRFVAMTKAAERLATNLQETWIERREAQLAASE